jgi:hypothetical protein
VLGVIRFRCCGRCGGPVLMLSAKKGGGAAEAVPVAWCGECRIVNTHRPVVAPRPEAKQRTLDLPA